MNAPVCPISRSQLVPGQPGLLLPVLTSVADLPSAIAAANNAAAILRGVGGTPVNNLYPTVARPGGNLQQNNNGGGGPHLKGHNWVENMKKRAYEQERIYKMDDNNQRVPNIWIDIVRITHMELRDTQSGDTLVFDYYPRTDDQGFILP